MARPRNVEREESQVKGPAEPMFVTWNAGDAKGRAAALMAAAGALANVENAVYHAHADFFDAGSNLQARQGLSRGDYDYYRPWEGRPVKPRDIIYACMKAYDEFGIVRNIIDTMSDFATQGISLAHPNPRIEKFYQEWFAKVSGPDRSERMANLLFRAANCPVRRHTATLKKKDVSNLQRGVAGDVSVEPPFVLGTREIPWRYTIMNPVQMVVLGGDLVPFIGPGAFTYAVQMPNALLQTIKRPKNVIEKQLIRKLPENVRQAIKDGMNVIPLNSESMRVLFYKRDDWQVWATPMTYALLDDLKMLRKLKLADLSALDGAISHIRIWKLGSLKNRMMPTAKAIQKLADMLANAGNGVSMDLIWGPDLELSETSTEVHRFLGEAKYAPHLNAIYAGYGIPPTLTGAATTGGFSNNFISLKTLTERLQYVRRVVREFWEYEVSLVQQGMSFRLPALVRFDRMVLTDEAAEKALLVQLADRDLVSVETLQERFGEDPVLEAVRQRKEARLRDKSKIPPKAGAFHNPNQEHDKLKQFIDKGMVSPHQAGLDLGDKAPGEKTLLEHQADQAKLNSSPDLGDTRKGQPGQGRPRLSKDKKKRKRKEIRVRARASLIEALSWSEDAMKAVAEGTLPAYLESCRKKNLRQLTVAQGEEWEKFKFSVLVNLPYGQKVDNQALRKVLGSPLRVPGAVTALLKETVASYREKEGREPPVEKVREFMVRIVALHKGEVY